MARRDADRQRQQEHGEAQTFVIIGRSTARTTVVGRSATRCQIPPGRGLPWSAMIGPDPIGCVGAGVCGGRSRRCGGRRHLRWSIPWHPHRSAPTSAVVLGGGRRLMTHKYRGCIVVLSINKSVKPNEDQKVLTSGFDQGFTINTSKRVFRGI
jgi:hypothetical protein